MYRVFWLRTARTRLADSWVNADSDTRAAITTAAAELDRELKSHPLEIGESREPNVRIFIVGILVGWYRIDVDSNEVTVLTVHVYRKRSS